MRRTSWVGCGLVAALALGLAAPALALDLPAALATAKAGQKDVVSPLLKEPPKVDGSLDDAFWANAASVGGFCRVKTSEAAAEQTLALVAHTQDALCLGFAVRDAKVAARERKRDVSTWEDDCVEIFLDPDRNRKDKFHIVVSAAGMLYDAKDGKAAWNASPDIQAAAKRVEGWGWTAEVVIPFKALGAAAPVQGEAWDLKLTREDYDVENETPKLSSWQPTGESFSDAGAYGRLVFVDRNCAANGAFGLGLELPKAGESWSRTLWRVAEKSVEQNQAGLVLEETAGHDAPPCGKVLVPKGYAQVQLLVPIRPRRNYELSAWVNMDGMSEGARLEFSTDRSNKVMASASRKGWQAVSTHLASKDEKGAVLVFTAHSGTGSYLIDDVTVVEVDNIPRDPAAVCFTGNATGSQKRHNKQVQGRYTYLEYGSVAPFFPQNYGRDTADVVEYAGWIPFSKGKLTDGEPTFSKYHEWTASPGKSLLVDLGADYYVTDVEIEPVERRLRDVRLLVKADKAEHYTLVARSPENGGERRLAGGNGHVRWLRIDGDGECGLREARVWGMDKPGAVAPTPLAPAVNKAPECGKGGPALAERTFSIFPTPKEFKAGQGRFLLTDGYKVLLASGASPETLQTAGDLIEQVERRAGARGMVAKDDGAIRLVLRAADGGKEDQGPEGYRLTVSDKGAEIVAGGESGLFYGCQSLLQTLETRGEEAFLRHAQVRDWPSYSFRAMQTWPRQFRNADVVGAMEVLARAKMNLIIIMGTDASALPAARKLAALRMESVPGAAVVSGNSAWPALEMKPDETRKTLPSFERVNPCPSAPENMAYLDKEVAAAALFPGRYVYLNCDEMYQEAKGSRWNVCPLCVARKLDGGELYRQFLQTIYDRFAAIGKKPVMMDTAFCIPYKGMDQAFARLPKDIPIMVWHPQVQKGLEAMGFSVGEFFDDDRWSIDPTRPNVIGGYVPGDGGLKLERGAVYAEALWSGQYPDLNSPSVLRRMSDVMTRVCEAGIGAPLPSGLAQADGMAPLDLGAAASVSLADTAAGDGQGLMDMGPGTDLSFMRGDTTLNGVPFRIGGKDGRDIVVIENKGALDPVHPSETRFPVGRKAASLVFLHALTHPLAWSYAAQLTYAGTYFIEYADGSRVAYPIEYKQNILEIDALSPLRGGGYKSRLVTVPKAVPGYQATLPCGEPILLMSAEWVNPFPAEEIAAITVRSTSRMIGTRVALFGVTAVAPTQRDERLWASRKTPVLAADPPRAVPAGLREIDLSGGDLKGVKDYTAPDGTRLEVTKAYTLLGATFIADMKPGLVTLDTNQGWQTVGPEPQGLTITFPQPRDVAAVSLLGLPQTPEYTFGGVAEMDVDVEATPDGETWRMIASRKGYLADRDWEAVFAFEKTNVKALRIVVRPTDPRGTLVRGLARVKVFAPETK